MSIDRVNDDRHAQHRSQPPTHLFDDVGSSADIGERLTASLQPDDRGDFEAPIESLRHFRLGEDRCRFGALVDTVAADLTRTAHSPRAGGGEVTIQTTALSELVSAFVASVSTALEGWFGPRPVELIHPTRPDAGPRPRADQQTPPRTGPRTARNDAARRG